VRRADAGGRHDLSAIRTHKLHHMQTEQVVVTRASLPKEGTQERQVYDTLLAAGLTFTYSDYFERVLWLSQFHRALHNLKHRFEIEIGEAPDRNVHGFKGYRLKQEQLAML
jgi:hypothetical protein